MLSCPSELKFPEFVKAPVNVNARLLPAKISPLLLVDDEVRLSFEFEKTLPEFVKEDEEVIAESRAENIKPSL